MNSYYDYLYTKKLDIDLTSIRTGSEMMYNVVMNHFIHDQPTNQWYDLPTTSAYGNYNCFLYPFPGMHELYVNLRDFYRSLVTTNEPAYVQCWINVFNKGEFIDWHTHSDKGLELWHGLYIVNGEGSHTSYRVDGHTFDIPSEDNLLILGKSEGDEHKSSEWNKDTPRVTIAFDIVPAKNIHSFELNHWVPI